MQGAAKAAGAKPAAAPSRWRQAIDGRYPGGRPSGQAATAPPPEKPAAEKPRPPGRRSDSRQAQHGRHSGCRPRQQGRSSSRGAAAEAPVAEPSRTCRAAPVAAAPLRRKPKPAASAPAFTPGQRPSVSEILAWCRQHDAK